MIGTDSVFKLTNVFGEVKVLVQETNNPGQDPRFSDAHISTKATTVVSGISLGSAILTSESDICLKLDARENSCLIKNASHREGGGEGRGRGAGLLRRQLPIIACCCGINNLKCIP